MKYKVGDKVLLKTWEQMVEEFDMNEGDILLPNNRLFTKDMGIFVENSSNRIATIKLISPPIFGDMSTANYKIKEYKWAWDDFMIISLAKEEKEEEIYRPTKKRWEILDIR